MKPVESTNFHSRKQNRSDILKQFQSRYFATSRLVSFPWRLLENELERSNSSDVILEILKRTCLHALCRKFPPSPRYRKCFLSELIKRVSFLPPDQPVMFPGCCSHGDAHLPLEAAECEPLDELYDALAEVVAAQDVAEGYRTYFLELDYLPVEQTHMWLEPNSWQLCGNSVSLLENVALVSEGTTGLVTWQAALYLAEWALDHAQIFAGRKVLELGSGAGLTGVAVCHSCAPSSYVFSDCHQSVLQRLRDNLSINGLLNNKTNTSRTEVRVQELDWTDVTEERLNDVGADVVIAADVVYDPDVIAVLVQLLSKILKRGGVRVPSEVFICSTVRNPQTYAGFKHSLSAAGIGHRVMSGAVNHVFEYNRESEIELVQLFACQ